MRFHRPSILRLLLVGLFAGLFGNAAAEEATVRQMTAEEAREAAIAGEIVLLDIRTPGEWAQTGIGDVAIEADMTSDAFAEILFTAVDNDRSRPVGVICRTGARSSYMTEVLKQNGFTNIVNVPEGMAGSRAGPGWLKKGLPLRKPGDAPGCASC